MADKITYPDQSIGSTLSAAEFNQIKTAVNGNIDDTVVAKNAADTAQGVAAAAQQDIDTHELRTDNPHGVTKAQVGLSNVNNTADANKPISTATQAALDLKQNSATGFGLISTSDQAKLNSINLAASPIVKFQTVDKLTTTSALGVSIFEDATVEPFTEYLISVVVRAASPTTSSNGVKFGLVMPNGATASITALGNTTSNSVLNVSSPPYTTAGIAGQSFLNQAITVDTAARLVSMSGRFTTGANGGIFNILGAASTEGQQANFYKDNSFLRIEKVSSASIGIVNENLYSNGGTKLFEDVLTTISNQYINQNTAWTVASDGASPTATGLTNRLILQRQYAIADRSFFVRVRLAASNRLAIFSSYNQADNPPTSPSGSMFELDVAGASVKLYNSYGDNTTVPTVLQSYPFTFNTDRDYILELQIRDDYFKSTLYITDGLTGLRTAVYTDVANDRRWNDYIGFASFAGTNMKIKSVRVTTPVNKNPHLAIYGDSITAARTSPLLPLQGASYTISQAVGRESYVSGRSAGVIAGVRARIQTEAAILLPKYIAVQIGTNNTAAEITAQYQALINDIVAIGAIPILNNVPAKSDAADKNAAFATFRASGGYGGVLLDIATSLNYNVPSGPDLANYIDTTHPNAILHRAMDRRWYLDYPDVFL